jgi:hypothetical protein
MLFEYAELKRRESEAVPVAWMVGYEKGKAVVAQAVNVAAIREVIETLKLSDETYFSANAMRHRCHGLADKLVSAIPKDLS